MVIVQFAGCAGFAGEKGNVYREKKYKTIGSGMKKYIFSRVWEKIIRQIRQKRYLLGITLYISNGLLNKMIAVFKNRTGKTGKNTGSNERKHRFCDATQKRLKYMYAMASNENGKYIRRFLPDMPAV